MNKLAILLAALLGVGMALAAPAVAKPKRGPGPERAAKLQCEALAGAGGAAYDAAYGTRGARACVRAARPAARAAVREGAAGCRAERGHSARSRAAFRREYGSASGRNDAFGNCVSAALEASRHDALAAFKRAIRECRAERGDSEESRAAFAQRYGPSSDDPLAMYLPSWVAFGNCIVIKLIEEAGAG